MKILHIAMCGPYSEGATYQENFLVEEHVKLGHQVVVWASTNVWEDGQLVDVGKMQIQTRDGATLKRFCYKYVVNQFITEKLRICDGVYSNLETENPDLIMMHSAQTAIVSDICKYLDKHKEVRFLIDSHSDYFNSAKSFFSKYVLHKVYYKHFMKKAYRYAEKMYCISPEVKRFNEEMYNLSERKMELLPLGGQILSAEKYNSYRKKKRDELGIPEEAIHVIHSGKMGESKNTNDLIYAIESLNSKKIYLTMIGSCTDMTRDSIERATRRCSNIKFLEWVDGNELIQYLCSGDIYALPRAQSATVQCAMCCGCAVEVFPYENYRTFQQNDICYASNAEELKNNLQELCNDEHLLKEIKKQAYDYAKEELSYSVQAKYIIEND